MNKSDIREIASRAFNFGFSTERTGDIEILNFKFKRWFEETFDEIINDNKIEDMEITKETKIGDIMPEGMEPTGIVVNPPGGMLNIPIQKKKEEKDFEWYYNKYLKYENYLDDNAGNNILGFLINKNYTDIVFEFKIGLLKFICDDLNRDFQSIIGKLGTHITGISDICPKEFLQSILK